MLNIHQVCKYEFCPIAYLKKSILNETIEIMREVAGVQLAVYWLFSCVATLQVPN